MQESAFARAGWRDDGNHLSLPQTQVGIRQNRETLLAAPVDFFQITRFHDHGSNAWRTWTACLNCLTRVVLRLGHSDLKANPLWAGLLYFSLFT